MGANKKIEIMAFFSNPRNDPAQKKIETLFTERRFLVSTKTPIIQKKLKYFFA